MSPSSFAPETSLGKSSGTPAFKEWAALVVALGQGKQIIILRKGGIAEGVHGFQIDQPRFWLFPTRFHQQLERIRPEWHRRLQADQSATARLTPGHSSNREGESPAPLVLEYAADVVASAYLDDWAQVAALNSFHYWSEETLQERFAYLDRPGMRQGLHLLVLRVARASAPIFLPDSPDFSGCKSWIRVPAPWESSTFTPVLDDSLFWDRQERLRACLTGISFSHEKVRS